MGIAEPVIGRAFALNDPAIHVFLLHVVQPRTWMPGTRPGMTNIRTRDR